MKILIITAFFPPINSIASLRPDSWAKYWSKAGHEVTVLVPGSAQAVDDDRGNPGVAIRRIPLPGQRWLNAWRDRGAAASSEMPRIASASPAMGRLSHWTFRWLYRLRTRYGFGHSCRMPDVLDLWAGRALRAANAEHWDLVVSTSGPYSVHRPAAALRKSGRARFWIADWRDLWVDNPMFPGVPFLRPIERWLERRWCERADIVTTVSVPLAQSLERKYGPKVHVVYNGYEPEDAKNLPRESWFGPNDPRVRIVYTGSLYPGLQDPTPLFQAMRQLHDQGVPEAHNVGVYFCGRGTERALEVAQHYGVADQVRCMGLVSRELALRLQRDASILLLLEIESASAKGVLTGKLFEYMSASAPIVALGKSADDSVGKMLLETGRGCAIGTKVSMLADLLQRYLRGEAVLAGETDAHRSAVHRYTRETQAKVMLNLLPAER